jgi:preprotein translocase subunit SecD
LDDNGLYRHPDLEALNDEHEEDPTEVEAKNFGLNFVKLDGNVGCMVNGAGLAMATMDIIQLSGGKPANFLDVGGTADAQRVENAFRIILRDPNVDAILINVFGGIVRCERIAQGVVDAYKNIGNIHIPIVVRLQGNGADDAAAVLVTCDRSGGAKYILAPAEVLGRQISKASAGLDPQAGSAWFVSITFDSEGTSAFGALTSRVTALPEPTNQVAIVLDGLVVSSPRITEAIPSGNAQITGSFTQLEAQDLANVLKYGALPLAFDRGEVQQVSPTLGADQLNAGVLAAGLGMLLVVIFTLLYYRALGLVTVGSLAVAAVMLYTLILLMGQWVGFTLTLAGIAGAITAIGVTADSFIVYFERVKDEMREGRSLRTAAETGWVRARRTILIADFVSLIAAVLLYIFSVGGVRGFAFTLGLTTIIDLIIIFLFTKPALVLISRSKFFNSGHPLSGFSPKSLGLVIAKEA